MRMFWIMSLLVFGSVWGVLHAMDTSAGSVRIAPMVTGLGTLWAIGLLPDGSFLVTEWDGDLLRIADGAARRVSGVPSVAANGQGGLLDVTIRCDFAQTREIFLAYAKLQRGGGGTALAVAKLSADGRRLTNVRAIFESAPGSSGGRHFGSRVVEGRDGTLYVTIGDRGDRNGTVVRINRDGSVPRDNPFVGLSGVQPEIWSFGH